jgi:superfamily II DNA/RNA helicase
VLAPTRELAAQIERELAPLAAVRDLRVDTVYGGVGYDGQKKAMARGVDILVACPGRLLDLVRQRIVNLNDVDRVVIDEADRLADMGFLDDVRKLIDMTSRDRQTLLFSATLDGEVAVLTRNYQHNPVRHEVGTKVRDSARKATHFFWQVLPHERIAATVKVVEEAGPTIVFCSTRHATDRVAAGEAANMAKYAAAEAGLHALDAAIQTHGGNGMTSEYGLADMWGMMRLLRIAPVSREMILNFVAQHVLDLPKSY